MSLTNEQKEALLKAGREDLIGFDKKCLIRPRNISNQPNAYKSNKEYIDEVKQINGLSSETIHEGQHLLIVYYDTEIR